MDLGIRGRRALVVASSRGLGKACAAALCAEGVDVVINGRGAHDLAATATELRALNGGSVTEVLGDATTGPGRAALLEACPNPDIVVLNGSGPPPMPFTTIDEQRWIDAAHDTMIAPLLLVRSVIDGMRERRFGRIVTITSAMVKSPRPLMALSIGSRTGLTGVLKALSKEVVRDNVTINQLLPERIDTGRQHQMALLAMEREGITYEQARADQVASIAARRLGLPEEFGAACAFLCSVQASFISGQNLQLDGGSYEGLF
jgi:3-oxoacyl-[acyl-carrier protein] reductase